MKDGGGDSEEKKGNPLTPLTDVQMLSPETLSYLTSPVSVSEVKDYRYYLRMWAKEKEPKRETIKDLPRMNQVRRRQVCFHLYSPL